MTCFASIALAENAPTIQIRTISVAPYGIEAENRNSGIYYDLANALADHLVSRKNIKVSHKIYPYARIIHELKNGKTGLSILFKYEELEQHVHYIAALPELKNVVMGLNGQAFNSVADLEGKTIAYLRGATFSEEIDNNPKIIKITTNNFRQGIDMLMAERVDAIIGPIDPILSAAQKLKIDKDLFGPALIVSTKTPWLQISNLSKLRYSIDDIKKYFNEILAAGKLNSLREKYLTYEDNFNKTN